MIRPTLRIAWLALGALALSACSDEQRGPVIVSVIGEPQDFARPLERLPDPGAKLILEATAQGLVAFDAAGEILPALAQRWVVEDDGKSYLFRLRRAAWANGARVSASDVARMLRARIDTLRRIDPGGPLDAVLSVRPMTGEVLELRLGAPRPYILQLLAQPQMALLSRDGGTGPYRRKPFGRAAMLSPVDRPTTDDGEEASGPAPAWQTRILRAERAALAVVRFRAGQAALVLGGRLSDLPLAIAAGLDRDSVRMDPVEGLFGLAVTGGGPLLDDDAVREAINLAIDRDQIASLMPIGRWTITDQLVPQQLDLPRPPSAPRWNGAPIGDRQAQARATIQAWRAAHGDPPPLRIALPAGPGSTLLFAQIAHDLAAIGLPTQRVSLDEATPDLRLIDEVAAYDSALWYLGRIGCARHIHCNPAAAAALQAASLASNAQDMAARIAEAEALAVAHNGYIPIGMPVRWSLAAPRLSGFLPSPRARHPLNHLFRSTN
jgi:peptide/nickel transport system substrate-binding protein